MTRVKICGVTESFHALAPAEAGAEMVGVNFASSRRRVSSEKAGDIVRALKARHPSTLAVGIFVNTPAAEVNSVVEEVGLDMVQLSGDESWEQCLDVRKPVVKSVRVRPGVDMDSFLACLERGVEMMGPERLRFLVDAYVEDNYGGTGTVADWGTAKRIADRFPIMLAGGLIPENVGQAIEQVRPWGVDVTSGVETDGVKDTTRIREFLEAVRRADEGLLSSN
jgi:phosphoribosylanthranilate isomerase